MITYDFCFFLFSTGSSLRGGNENEWRRRINVFLNTSQKYKFKYVNFAFIIMPVLISFFFQFLTLPSAFIIEISVQLTYSLLMLRKRNIYLSTFSLGKINISNKNMFDECCSVCYYYYYYFM